MAVAFRACILLTLWSLCSASVAWSEEKDSSAAEFEKLAGTYAFLSAERNGEGPPPEAVKDYKTVRVVIKGNSLKFTKQGKPDRSNEIKIDPTKTPKQIDLTGTTNDGKKKRTILGIYSLEGKVLKLCMEDPGKERPTDFITKGKRTVLLLVLERE